MGCGSQAEPVAHDCSRTISTGMRDLSHAHRQSLCHTNAPHTISTVPLSSEASVLNLRYVVNREAMAGTSPGRQSGESARSERNRVPEGRHAYPDKMPVVPSRLWSFCRSVTMDLRPWLSHVMPSAFENATSRCASDGHIAPPADQ